jgi:hypothetical protein
MSAKPEADIRTRLVLSAFDDLVGAGEYCRCNGEAEGLRGLEVDEKLEFSRLFDRQIGGSFAFENLVDIDAGASEVARWSAP